MRSAWTHLFIFHSVISPDSWGLITLLIRQSFLFTFVSFRVPIAVAVRSNTWVRSSSLAGIAGTNPAGDMDVFELDVHGSVHRNIILIERTNKMQPRSRIYYSNVS